MAQRRQRRYVVRQLLQAELEFVDCFLELAFFFKYKTELVVRARDEIAVSLERDEDRMRNGAPVTRSGDARQRHVRRQRSIRD